MLNRDALLPSLKGFIAATSQQLREAKALFLGRAFGAHLASELTSSGASVGIISTASEFDGFARGVFQGLTDANYDPKVGCFWINHTMIELDHYRDFAQVEQEFLERLPTQLDHLIFASMFVSDQYDLAASVYRAMVGVQVSQLHILSPVIYTNLAGNITLPFEEGISLKRHTLFDSVTILGVLTPDERESLKTAATVPVTMPAFAMERMGLLPDYNRPRPQPNQPTGAPSMG